MPSIITRQAAKAGAVRIRFSNQQPSLFRLPTMMGCILMHAAVQASAASTVSPELRLQTTLALANTTAFANTVRLPNTATRPNRGPLALEQLVELAIDNHPTVSAKRADLEVARADLALARQAFYPTPSVLLQQGHNSNGTVLALQQPLWSGGRLSAGANAATAHAMAADVAIIEAQFALATRVTNAYQSWLQAHGRAAAFTASIDQLASFVERISRRIQGGASAEVDRVLVYSRLLQAQSDLAAARSAELAALVQLSQAIGTTLRVDDLGVSAADPAGQVPPTLDKLIAEAARSNPSLRRIDFDIATAQYETEQKRAARWPTVSLRAEHQRSIADGGARSKDSRLFVVLEYTPGAGASAAMQVNGQLARAQSLRESAEAIRRDLVERIAIEYQDYQTGQRRLNDLQGLLGASRDVLASYDRLFVAGKRGWLDVVNAARELTQVAVTQADLTAQQIGARYRLRLLGNEQPWLNRVPEPIPVEAPFLRLIQAVNLGNSL